MAPGGLGEAVLTLATDDSKYVSGLASAEQKAGKLEGTFGKVAGAGRILTGVVGGTVVGALGDFARAAAEDEANTLKLQVAVENSGVKWGDYADKIDAVIANGQRLAFSDDDTRNSLAALTESTGSVEEAMTRLPIAMDLARAKNISLEAASKLLGKVNDENTKVLKKYGITVDENATATDVLAKVQRMAGGQAEAYGSTTSASIAKVKDQVGEMTESVGASLGPFQGMIALLPGVSSGMSVAGGAVGALSGLIKGTMIPSFLATVPAVVAMMAPFAPLILIIGAIGLAAIALKMVWDSNLGDIQGKTQAVLGFLGGAFEWAKDTITTAWNALGRALEAAKDFILAPVRAVIGVVQGAIDLINRLRGEQAKPQPAAPTVPTFYGNRGAYEGPGIFISGPPPAPRFHSGGVMQYDGLANLQRGETVLPRSATIIVPLYLDGREIARALGDLGTRRAGVVGLAI